MLYCISEGNVKLEKYNCIFYSITLCVSDSCTLQIKTWFIGKIVVAYNFDQQQHTHQYIHYLMWYKCRPKAHDSDSLFIQLHLRKLFTFTNLTDRSFNTGVFNEVRCWTYAIIIHRSWPDFLFFLLNRIKHKLSIQRSSVMAVTVFGVLATPDNNNISLKQLLMR